MGWNTRWIGVGMSAWLLTGCASDMPEWARSDRSLSADLISPGKAVVRSQVGDSPPVTLKQPFIPPPPAGFGVKETPTQPKDSGILPTSMANRGTVRVRVRAWVNGAPIFDDEVMQIAAPELRRVSGFSESQRAEKITELFNAALDQIIDQEVMYQDAMKKLKKVSPHSIDKMRDYVDQEYDKRVQRLREAKVPEDAIREMEPTDRRMLERSLIATEYARSRIKPVLESIVSLSMISDYYDTHKNEFQTVDKVVWQDIFIPISPNLPTIEAAKRFGEELINGLRSRDDFTKLMVYDQGDSKLRGGEGLGQRRGEIRPQELEAILFDLKEGEIGPVVAFSTGVHLIRVTKREYAKQLVLDDQVSKTIRKKLEEQLANREYRRIVRELRTRTMIVLERDGQ